MNVKILNQLGQALTEYIILVILVAVVCITATTALGTKVRGKIDSIERALSRVNGG